jgi:aminoglycoside phosphotransferase (APT) family kinase protein
MRRMMRLGGDRRGPVALKADEAERLVRVVYPGADVLEVKPVATRRGTASFRLIQRGAPSPMLLRVYATEPTACAREVAVLGALPRVVPVAAVCHTAPDADPPWSLFAWLHDGPMSAALRIFSLAEALMLASDLGAVLSAVHRIRFERSGFLGADLSLREPLQTWSDLMSGRLEGGAGNRLGEEVVARLRAFVARHASEMDALYEDAALCHGAFIPANVVVHASSGTDHRTIDLGWVNWRGWSKGSLSVDDRPRIAGIVDWASAFAGPSLFDLGTLLRHDAALPAGFCDAFAEGYRRWDAPLPRDWRQLARRLDLVNLCGLVERGDERVVARVRNLIEATLQSD